MSFVLLGNVAVREVIGTDDETGAPVHRDYDHHASTEIQLPDTWTEQEKFRQVTHETGFWPAMSSAPAAWVESDDVELAQALAYFYGCPIGRPDDWEGMGK